MMQDWTTRQKLGFFFGVMIFTFVFGTFFLALVFG